MKSEKLEIMHSLPIHLVVKEAGSCKKCNIHNEKQVYDFGKLSLGELEKRLDHMTRQIKPLTCRKCGQNFLPEYVTYYDLLSGKEVAREAIDYINVTPEEQKRMLESHNKRYDIFKEHESSFWEKYEEFALANWTKIIKEISKDEFQEGYKKLNIVENFRSIAQYRKDALARFVTGEQKRQFWRAVNDYFIYKHLLEIGPKGWLPERDVKEFGLLRTRFVIMHFPLHDALENLRTEYIGRVVSKDRSDSNFLFQRITQLTDELNRVRKKNVKLFHQNEELKVKIAILEGKLYKNKLLNEAHERTQVANRHPDDIRKIAELKSFVKELIAELKQANETIHQLGKKDKSPSPATLDETTVPCEDQTDLSLLKGKTIGIIGGKTSGEMIREDEDVQILIHDGSTLDPEFYSIIKRSDILVVLTKFVSHMAMWETRAHAINEDKPVFYVKMINIDRILNYVANKIDEFTRER